MEVHDCSSLAMTSECSLPKLTNLELRRCQNLNSVGYIPSVTTMEIRCCPNLSAVSFVSLPSLNKLKLMYCLDRCGVCSLITWDLKYKHQTGLLIGLLNDLPSLEFLEFYNMSITQIPLKQKSLPSLTWLRLSNCYNLQHCDELATLTYLKHLEVWNCPKLYLYPPELDTLIIRDTGYQF
ncbi:unnamed protein product [Urochloa humidicola]